MSSVNLNPKGRTFVRKLILQAVCSHDDVESRRRFAVARWGEHAGDQVAKAAVSAISAANIGNTDAVATEFFDLVRERSVFGRLAGLRRIPFHTRMLSMASGARGYWVGQAKPKPLSKPAMTGDTIKPAKVATIVAQTKEALQRGGNAAEDAVQRDMQRAVTDAWDEAFLDASNAGIADEMPASVTYGAPTVASTGDAAADIAALIAAFDGDLSAAYFITDPKTAAQLALANGGTLFPDAGPRGGSLLGIPLLTSRSSPRGSSGGQIALVDPTGIAANDEDLGISVSTETTLAMRDDPEDSPTTMVSLWQTNTVAFLAEIMTNWSVQRADSVVVLTDADYPQGT